MYVDVGKSDKERIFRFKQFSVRHQDSAMKVGVDAVLLGSWANITDADTILDAGSGCGVIALMCAQRNAKSQICAIDIDLPAVKEASQNFADSPWSDRLSAKHADFEELSTASDKAGYDHIISNPPYFNSGVVMADSPRLISRHALSLSPVTLITLGEKLLTPSGKISMICPPDWLPSIEDECARTNMKISRLAYVAGSPGKPAKRLLIEISRFDESSGSTQTDEIVIEESRGVFTEKYISLTQDFYLNF